MDIENLLNNTLGEFLMECVSDKIQDPAELPKMLQKIGYLDNKEEYVSKITACEILDVNEAFVESHSVSGREINVKYRIDFIMQTFVGSDALWRVQGCAALDFSIPDENSVDWSVFDLQDGRFFDYYNKLKGLVNFKNVEYSDVECDTL